MECPKSLVLQCLFEGRPPNLGVKCHRLNFGGMDLQGLFSKGLLTKKYSGNCFAESCHYRFRNKYSFDLVVRELLFPCPRGESPELPHSCFPSNLLFPFPANLCPNSFQQIAVAVSQNFFVHRREFKGQQNRGNKTESL